MNNLKKFATEADYNAATLNYPAVSWVTATDNVHFDKTAPIVVNDKVMMAWHSTSDVPSGKDIVLWNAGQSLSPTVLFNSLTINNVDVMGTIGSDATLENYSVADTDYLVKYELKADTTITDIYSGDLGGGWVSSAGNVDFLIPSQVTNIHSIPSNVGKLVIEAATPPTTSLDFSSITASQVFVPDSAVNTYKSASGWSSVSNMINPISEYQGNLPV
jgi:hypothetical protein